MAYGPPDGHPQISYAAHTKRSLHASPTPSTSCSISTPQSQLMEVDGPDITEDMHKTGVITTASQDLLQEELPIHLKELLGLLSGYTKDPTGLGASNPRLLLMLCIGHRGYAIYVLRKQESSSILPLYGLCIQRLIL